MAINEDAADSQTHYCKDCKYQSMAETKIIPSYAICTRRRVVKFSNLVTGPYEREYVNMSCKSERYPEVYYVLKDEEPCDHEGKYFEPKEKT